jgi:AraC-binding-like domain
MSAIRTDRMAARVPADDLMFFSVYMAGQGRLHQHDRCAELAAGTGVLVEARSRYERVTPTETGNPTLRFSRELLLLRTAEITEACARSIDPATPAMQMLSGYFGRLFEVADDLTEPQRLDAGRAAIDLLAMALRDVTPSVPGGVGSAGVLLDMMRTHIREHLADPQLGVAERDHARCVPSPAAATRGTGAAVRPEIRPARGAEHCGCRRVPRSQYVRAGVPAAVRDDAGRLAA